MINLIGTTPAAGDGHVTVRADALDRVEAGVARLVELIAADPGPRV
jgi:hypothetical protein